MTRVNVLDHGYVELIECWGRGKAGSDATAEEEKMSHQIVSNDFEVGIIEAARQSTQGSFRGWDEDWKLLQFLYSSVPPHAGPFEFAGMIIEVQAPLMVFREWHRHRTQSYNEMSARYTPLPPLYYIPTVERVMMDGGKNKQAQGTGAKLMQSDAEAFLIDLLAGYSQCEQTYQDQLTLGVPKELARLIMPVGHYSRMRAQATLRNWLAFMTLRCDPAAQWEIRQYADIVAGFIASKFPRTYSQWLKKI